MTHETSVDDVGELLEADVPWHDETTVIELVRNQRVLVRREVGREAPLLKVEFPPAADLAARRGRIAYRADSSASDVAVTVRYTSDGGATWTAP